MKYDDKTKEQLIDEIKSLHQRIDELEKADNNLEFKVKERTKELVNCNIRLENDIGEIKRIGIALKESEEKFRALAENSPDIISRLNKELEYVYINHGSNTLGLSPEKFIGKKIGEISPYEEITRIWVKNARKVLLTGKMQEMEYGFPSINGLKVFHTYMVPEYDKNGEIESILAICRDITKRKQLEDKLKKIVLELRHSNEELQQFAYVASHDLKEPLRTVASFTQLIKIRYGDKLGSEADEYIEFIVNGTKRMQQLIDDLLDYSRITTKGNEFNETDLEKVLDYTFNNLNTLIRENNAKITHNSLPKVMGDSGQLVQLFQNIITNAIKFRKENEPPRIHISCALDNKRKECVFRFSDNGIGIDPQYTGRIFTLFQRLHSEDKYEGTGIGLTISKKIVEHHGGRIWVESELDKGSTFCFTLPKS